MMIFFSRLASPHWTAQMEMHEDGHVNISTACLCNIIFYCAMKCFMASQDKMAPKVNRLATDKKKLQIFSLPPNSDVYFMQNPRVFFPRILICSLSPTEKNIDSFCFVKCSKSKTVPKTMWVMHSICDHALWLVSQHIGDNVLVHLRLCKIPLYIRWFIGTAL